jgi:hypothetical protein
MNPGKGRVGAECGWAALNWLGSAFNMPRRPFSHLYKVQHGLWLEHRALEPGQDHLEEQAPDREGWFSSTALSRVAMEWGITLTRAAPDASFNGTVALVGPNDAVRGHWRMVQLSSDYFTVRDTDSPWSFLPLHQWPSFKQGHTVLYARPDFDAMKEWKRSRGHLVHRDVLF